MHTKIQRLRKIDNHFFLLMSLNENNQPGKKALNDEFLKKAVEEGNNRSGKVKNGWFLRVGHCSPDHSSSPSNCTTIGYSEADGSPGFTSYQTFISQKASFLAQKREQESPECYQAEAGAVVALTQPYPHSWRASGKHKTRLQRHFALGWKKTVLILHNCPRNDNEWMSPCHSLFYYGFSCMRTSCAMT